MPDIIQPRIFVERRPNIESERAAGKALLESDKLSADTLIHLSQRCPDILDIGDGLLLVEADDDCYQQMTIAQFDTMYSCAERDMAWLAVYAGEEYSYSPERIESWRFDYKNKPIDDAIYIASRAHANTYRKGTALPYILHPMEAAVIAAGLCSDPIVASRGELDFNAVVSAALLHDTLEDTTMTADELLHRFGHHVLNIVSSESENKRDDLPAGSTWRIRKEETIEHLRNCDNIEVKIVAFADKLSNLRSIYRDWLQLGTGLWERFNQKDPTAHGWYYQSILDVCPEFKGTAAHEEYELLMGKGIFSPLG